MAVTCRHNKHSVTLVAHNDTLEQQQFDVSVRLFTVSGECTGEELIPVSLGANSQKEICTLPVTKKTVLEIRWMDHVVTELCAAPRNLHMKPVGLQVLQDGKSVTIKSDGFAYGVHIEADTAPDSNDFCVMPGEQRTVSFQKAPEQLHVTCVNNMPFRRRPLLRKLRRAQYRLEPRNIANEVYYSKK